MGRTRDPPSLEDHHGARSLGNDQIQVYKLPKARRNPTDVPWTHRGCFLLLSSGAVMVETGAGQHVVFPRQRFSAPVKFGIFWYGYAPQDVLQDEATPPEHQQLPPEPSLQPQADDDAEPRPPTESEQEITFSGLPPELPSAIRQAVRTTPAHQPRPPFQGRAEARDLLS